MAAALALLGLGAYAALSESGLVAAESAVVTSYVVAARAPIEGYVSGLGVRVGDTVLGGAPVARVEDPRVNDQRLVDLRQLAARHRAEREALEVQEASLASMAAALRLREANYVDVASSYIAARVAEAERQVEARSARAALAQRDLARRSSLGRDGFAAAADVDRLRAEAEVTEREVAAAQAGLAALRRQEQAAHRSVFVASGSNDVAYSAQRADEVALRASEVERAIAFAAASEREALARLASEERRVALLRSAELRLSAHGMVWKLPASNGERVAAGDAVVELVDCQEAFVVASVPQDKLPRLAVGAVARVRISGESADREGRVLAVTGDERLGGDRNLAAAPASARNSNGTARISLAPSGIRGAECLVGRTARVLLPTAGGRITLASLTDFLSRFI
jgi:multidrug resistance efflux pump